MPPVRSGIRARNRTATAIASLMLCFGAGAAAADQAPGDPVDDPRLENESVEGAAKRLGERTPGLDPVAPLDAGWAVPMMRRTAPTTDSALYPEGAFVIGLRGVMHRAEDRTWVFQTEDDPGHAAMVLQPSMRLTEMAHVAESRGGEVRLEVNAQVFLFEGRNYLLPLLFRILGDEADKPETPTALAGPPEDAAPSNDPDVDELIERLGRSAGPRAGAGSPADDLSDDEAPSRHLLSEGTMIVSRCGRIVRGAQGRWVLTFDNDADSEGGDPPMVLMACANAEDMIQLSRSQAGASAFVVSGSVFLYEGENFLLPVMYLAEINRSGNLTSAQ